LTALSFSVFLQVQHGKAAVLEAEKEAGSLEAGVPEVVGSAVVLEVADAKEDAISVQVVPAVQANDEDGQQQRELCLEVALDVDSESDAKDAPHTPAEAMVVEEVVLEVEAEDTPAEETVVGDTPVVIEVKDTPVEETSVGDTLVVIKGEMEEVSEVEPQDTPAAFCPQVVIE
jgi:hypothetical protein